MKVLHINNSDYIGGAAKASFRLHKALEFMGVNSTMLVCHKLSGDSKVISLGPKFEIKTRLYKKISENILSSQKTTNPILHSLNIFPTGLHRIINTMDIDIINLHWINNEMISIKEIAKINKPIVWTLHDSWMFLGAEHHPNNKDDRRYIEGYSRNNRNHNTTGLDINKWIWQRKMNVWKNKKINIVCPSNWLAESAKQSLLLKSKTIYHIPNTINTNNFNCLNKKVARTILNLPQNKKLILFGAMGTASDKNKGFNLLLEAIKYISNQIRENKPELVIFGIDQPTEKIEWGLSTHYLGRFYDDLSLKILYSACDVFVLPSLIENLPNVLLESMACGCPAVAFDVGGNHDIIDNKINGYLATPYEVSDLANGIEWCLSYDNTKLLTKNCIKKILGSFSTKEIGNKYLNLYHNIITSK